MQELRPIIALDFPSRKEVEAFLDNFPSSEKLFLKIGMELYYKEGPSIVQELREKGHDIFVDLKLHDIPNTVHRAMKNLALLGVSITNVHAAGGSEMMKEALSGLKEGTPKGQKVPRLIAVTQLTSTTEDMMQKEQGIPSSLKDSVVNYALLAQKSGLDGVVCSALEVEMIHKETAENFLCLTPGIRPKTAALGDQKRVVTPSKAKALGANFIVVGRPITQSKNPYQSYQAIKKEWSGENE